MIVKQNLDSVVYNLLIESFYNEEYRAGQILNPTEIAQKYNISKTPVLQSLKRLENENILEVSNGGKYTLIKPDAEKIKNICEIRYMFESYIVEVIIKSFDQEKYNILLDLVDKCNNIKDISNAKEVLKADYTFHKYMISMMNNSDVNEVYESIVNRYILLKYASGYRNELKGILERSYKSHKRIAELLLNGELEELKVFLKQHIYFEKEESL